MGFAAGLVWQFCPRSLTFIYEHPLGLITASLGMAIFQGLYCYISSFFGDKLLALGGNTGNPIYDVRNLSLWSPPILTFHSSLSDAN